MRVMMRVTVPVESGNKGIKDGSLPKAIQGVMERVHPEAAYFAAEHGKRVGYFFFDLKSSSELPPIAEPLFMGLNAEIEVIPVMNGDDLKAGLEAFAKSM